MSSASTFPSAVPHEEWADTEFDFPDGDPMQASDPESEKDEEDWDVEMDFGRTGGAKVPTLLENAETRCVASRPGSLSKHSRMVTIRPPLPSSAQEEEDDGEGISTIKISELPQSQSAKPPTSAIEEDFEDDFVLPSDMIELSLRPTPLAHRSSKSSMEWGDKDHTTSSQSSDAFSTFGFTDNSAPSSYTSASLPETETEDEDGEDLLDGLVLPKELFESGHGAKKLTRLLEKKKTAATPLPVAVSSPDPEEDFEAGLVWDDGMELSPSRLMLKALQIVQVASGSIRSKSVPARASAPLRPPSRHKGDRARSPNYPPVSSLQQFRKLPAPPPSLLLPSSSSRGQSYSQALTSGSSSSSGDPLSPKFGALRTQKSHTGLKPASPPSTRRITRKASLPAFSDGSSAQASGSGTSYNASAAKYDAPTASSRAKVHTQSTSRISALDYKVPPTRPTTPSANPAALRLTLPTSSSRLKTRAPISGIFSQNATGSTLPRPRSISPLPPSPAVTGTRSNPLPPTKPRASLNQASSAGFAPRILKRPKRLKTYGDGTELDGIDDLPLDREKEGRYRVQPKGYGTRVPGSSFSLKDDANSSTIKLDRTSLARTSSQDTPIYNARPLRSSKRMGSSIGNSSTKSQPDVGPKKKKGTSVTKRKPTLIRNLGGSGAPKVVGDMKWNPQTLRWEGNDQALRDFDAVVTSVRPALITQLTGSSVGSPVGNLASGARVVGNMFFDPSRMCWISTLPPEDDEPDVFADLADDEDDEWETKGATIRPGQQEHALKLEQDFSTLSRTRSKSLSETESDRCSRGSMVCDVEDGFVDKCHLAEERHRVEMKGWVPARGQHSGAPDRASLYEIRALATRKY